MCPHVLLKLWSISVNQRMKANHNRILAAWNIAIAVVNISKSKNESKSKQCTNLMEKGTSWDQDQEIKERKQLTAIARLLHVLLKLSSITRIPRIKAYNNRRFAA